MPFGLRSSVAAGLASLFTIVGGVVMLAAGATDRAVRWSAAQAIVLWLLWLGLWMLISLIGAETGFGPQSAWPYRVLDLLFLAAWADATIGAFRGGMPRIPIVASLTERLLKGTSH